MRTGAAYSLFWHRHSTPTGNRARVLWRVGWRRNCRLQWMCFGRQLRHAGLKRQDLAAIDGIMEALLQNLSGLLLNMAVARIGLEKGSNPLAPPTAPAEKATFLDPGRVA